MNRMKERGRAREALRRREREKARQLRREREEARRRQAQRVGAAGFALACLLPIVLWHRVIGAIAGDFRFDVNYLVTGWSPWVLMILGLAFFVPVAISNGRDPEGRFYPKARNAYAGWGITLYLLGFGLATQVAQITDSLRVG
jgi:hypothetical protein